MMKVCLTLLFLTLGGLSWATSEEESNINTEETCLCAQGLCKLGWVQYKSACYRKFNFSVPWIQAETTCTVYGSHLASIHSNEENNFVFALMGRPNNPNTGAAYWLGLNDMFDEGKYMNTDGSKVTFLPFGKGQPDNPEDEDFFGSWFIENGTVTWNDYSLKPYRFPFVCKYDLDNSVC